MAGRWSSLRTDCEKRTVSGDGQREVYHVRRSAFESELGFELAGVGSGCGVEFGGEEEE